MIKRVLIVCIILFMCVSIYAQSNDEDNKKLRYPSHPPNCCHNLNLNSNDLIVGINTNAGGAIPLGNIGDTTPSINIEFTNGKFNSEINIIISNIETIASGDWGIGFLSVFNYLWKIPFGEVYIGGGTGFLCKWGGENNIYDIMLGGNINFRYPFSIGMYLRAGAFIGGRLSFQNGEIDRDRIFLIRPDIGIGYSF